MPVVPQLGLHARIPFSMLELCLARAYIALNHAVCSRWVLPWCVWKTLFSWSEPAPLAGATLLPPFPHRFLSLERRGVMKTSHLGLNMESYLLIEECWRDGGHQIQNRSQGEETHSPFKLEGTGKQTRGLMLRSHEVSVCEGLCTVRNYG